MAVLPPTSCRGGVASSAKECTPPVLSPSSVNNPIFPTPENSWLYGYDGRKLSPLHSPSNPRGEFYHSFHS